MAGIEAQDQSFDSFLQELTQKFNIPQIYPDSLVQLNTLILDTHEIEEFDISHIEGAVYAGYNDFSVEKLNSIPKDTNIVVYCSVGYRSSIIAQQLREEGFKNVQNLYGGIFNWVNQNRKIVRDSLTTDSLHVCNEYWGRFVINPKIIKIPNN